MILVRILFGKDDLQIMFFIWKYIKKIQIFLS